MNDGNYLMAFASDFGLDVRNRSFAVLNDKIEKYGIVLSSEDINSLSVAVSQALNDSDRFEFKESAAVKIAEKFASSSFIDKRNFVKMISELTESFYMFRNEIGYDVSDNDIIDTMFMYFERRCGGSIELMMNSYFEKIVNDEPIDDREENVTDD